MTAKKEEVAARSSKEAAKADKTTKKRRQIGYKPLPKATLAHMRQRKGAPCMVPWPKHEQTGHKKGKRRGEMNDKVLDDF